MLEPRQNRVATMQPTQTKIRRTKEDHLMGLLGLLILAGFMWGASEIALRIMGELTPKHGLSTGDCVQMRIDQRKGTVVAASVHSIDVRFATPDKPAPYASYVVNEHEIERCKP